MVSILLCKKELSIGLVGVIVIWQEWGGGRKKKPFPEPILILLILIIQYIKFPNSSAKLLLGYNILEILNRLKIEVSNRSKYNKLYLSTALILIEYYLS
ncbi:uncharacterized protein RSE6_06969 [Rhynchosporium secalis]|uniref:Uncharacterized protein n=1 Tax=Rhynchosporium secalis TaxID=38038 RepID=A0A1E1MBS1_RHYSE|nr:uncharacterized protein RSE6_06969 [Rhynchosporium secalis]